ncbi:Sin-like protein conserved region-domain-containing protein, partial [Terfezia claveryi]
SDPDSDPVITTYDIHLTTALTPYLHLFQYPVRSSNLPYSRLTSTCPASARIKPNAGAIELDDDTVYVSFAEAKSAGRVLTTQTLSAHLHPQSTNYMVGVFRHNQLHLTPIHSTLQLRPQFTHIDTTISLEKDMQRALRIDPSGAPPPQARALQATVKQVGEEGAGVGGDALRALRREEGEEWVE